MSATAVTERPAHRMPPNGGVPARRAVVRWAIRLLRREWRQQLLILALITVAVGATVVASTVATDTPAPISGVLGTAQDAGSFSGSPASINAQIKSLEQRWGRVDVIENESAQIPGTLNTFELRAQDPHGPFGGPLLSLVSGAYPTTASQVAVTSGVASSLQPADRQQLDRRRRRPESNGHRPEPGEPARRVRPGHPRPGRASGQRNGAVRRARGERDEPVHQHHAT